MNSPLANRLRPKTLDEIVGQKDLLEKDRAFYGIIKSGDIPNMIFFGPSGVGKTTVAEIIAASSNKLLRKINGTNTSIGEIKEILKEAEGIVGINGVLLYLDEIQYLNKKQQQSLLESTEMGKVTLIASTTENPYFYIYNAILSRCTVFEFKPIAYEDAKKGIANAFSKLDEGSEIKILLEDGVIDKIASSCGGDMRKAINAVELSYLAAKVKNKKKNITVELVKQVSQKSNMRYDKDADEHYDILSAFQKSIRGSDENAALHYLARLIEAGDLPSIIRRLLVIAAEDIGLAFPNAIVITKTCCDCALQLGFPEARIPLADAVILLCTSPKSNSGICAIDAATGDMLNKSYGEIPKNIRDSSYGGAKKLGRGLEYKYPHSFKNNYVKQNYLPSGLEDSVYYSFGENKLERQAKEHREKILKESE